MAHLVGGVGARCKAALVVLVLLLLLLLGLLTVGTGKLHCRSIVQAMSTRGSLACAPHMLQPRMRVGRRPEAWGAMGPTEIHRGVTRGKLRCESKS